MVVLGAVLLGDSEAVLIAVAGAALFFGLGWLAARAYADRKW
jgi:hypothetical protein